MATRVNRAATASSKQGGKSKTRNRTVKSFNSHQSLDSPRNQRVFRENVRESERRRHDRVAGESPSVRDRPRSRPRVPRVSEPAGARLDQPKFRKKKNPSGRGISGGRIYIAAVGDRPKPKRTGWSRG